MPLQPKQLTGKEVIEARETALPTMSHILDLLLRGGAACYLEFERRFLDTCEVAFSTTRFTGPDGKTYFEKQPYTRANPEDLKQVLKACGVIEDAEHHRLIRVAYSDPVGFILADPFLSALCPVGQLPPKLARTVLAALPTTKAGSDKPAAAPVLPDRKNVAAVTAVGDVFICAPNVTADSALRMLAGVFQQGDGAAGQGPSGRAIANFYREAYDEAVRCFSPEGEQHQASSVPGVSVANFIAAQLILLYGDGSVDNDVFVEVVDNIEARLGAECAGVLEVAPQPAPSLRSNRGSKYTAASARAAMVPPPASVLAAATINHDKTCSMYDFAMTHTDVTRWNWKFPYYMQLDDRRDEWLRGRLEKDARGMYQRRVVGYGGHMPEFRFRFGRTFHVIEEDLPDLSKPKPPLEPLAPDAFGPGRALKSTQMSTHHFTFA